MCLLLFVSSCLYASLTVCLTYCLAVCLTYCLAVYLADCLALGTGDLGTVPQEMLKIKQLAARAHTLTDEELEVTISHPHTQTHADTRIHMHTHAYTCTHRHTQAHTHSCTQDTLPIAICLSLTNHWAHDGLF